jgi:hypothetical protein
MSESSKSGFKTLLVFGAYAVRSELVAVKSQVHLLQLL